MVNDSITRGRLHTPLSAVVYTPVTYTIVQPLTRLEPHRVFQLVGCSLAGYCRG